ncbi:hypothetical protein GCM10010112_41630 [Actinoplanes lobatus]|uniref:Lipoprotein n=2 Tax=Actinoplanes lobatus TaxID=113568 RepID=A0ABQ4AU33_9ACTN|nr:hypothetical protein GCM10010112_41630 [Actinoplanes lobatus]GIE44467.1 hypothetical protein Alo02nite_73650 [Actinoplanes lobatus]
MSAVKKMLSVGVGLVAGATLGVMPASAADDCPAWDCYGYYPYAYNYGDYPYDWNYPYVYRYGNFPWD